MKKIYKKRRRSRKILLQLLYAYFIIDQKVSIKYTIIEKSNKNKIDLVYLTNLVDGFLKKKKVINNILKYNLVNDHFVSVIDKIIIKIAIYDIFFNIIPFKVIINESIELSRIFSLANSYVFINKFLNSLIKGYLFNNKFFIE